MQTMREAKNKLENLIKLFLRSAQQKQTRDAKENHREIKRERGRE